VLPIPSSSIFTWLQHFRKKSYDKTLEVPVHAYEARDIVFNSHFLPSYFSIVLEDQTHCFVVCCFSLSGYSCIVFLHISHGHSRHALLCIVVHLI
jgi:hypothetical protein